MDAFPAYFPLRGQKVVIAGDGESAEAKARLFEGSPANVVRISGSHALLAGAYAGACLAFIAGEDEAFARAAVGAARAARVLVNVPDRPELCDFTTPSVIDRGEVVAAIGTGGASPMLAAMLRNDIEQRIPEGAGRIAVLFRLFQDEVRAAYPDLVQRRAFLREALSGPAAQAAQAGEMERAKGLFQASLARGVNGLGGVQFVLGKGPADLLTLRASRALAAADVLVADAGSDTAILALARRDAERMPPNELSAPRLIELARAGRRVVRVLMSPVSAAEVQSLVAADIRIEVLATVSPN